MQLAGYSLEVPTSSLGGHFISMLKNLKEFKLPEIEAQVLKFWKEHSIFEQSLAKNKGNKKFVFFEGPPTANGMPGIHHQIGRSFKDIIPRFKAMQGFDVPRKAGWDTHGLPVEIQAEKELGFTGKQDIEKYGIAEFNKKCKELVWRYRTEFENATDRLGFWVDMKHPYITYENSYIESLWWVIA
jgi:isoleucyl-tRNA synthetase